MCSQFNERTDFQIRDLKYLQMDSLHSTLVWRVSSRFSRSLVYIHSLDRGPLDSRYVVWSVDFGLSVLVLTMHLRVIVSLGTQSHSIIRFPHDVWAPQN